MEYLTDMHVHTRNIGSCASATPEAMVECFIAAGITTVVLTSHVTRRVYRQFGADTPEGGKVADYYINEYERAVRAAGGRLNILFGAEIRTADTGSDYLVYGITPEMLDTAPPPWSESAAKLSRRFRAAGCRIYQAHPFRDGQTVTAPELLDGIETENCNRKLDSRNDIAALWAEKFALPGVAGSDFHHTDSATGAGIITDFPITDNKTLLRVLAGGEYRIRRLVK